MKEIYQQTVEEVLERVNGKKSGLTSEQVKRSREKCGWNELTEGKKKGILQIFFEGAVYFLNRSPSSRQLKKYKFFLPVEIYLLAVFMQLASKFHVFPLALKFQDSFASVYCCSNLYNLRSFLREYLYQ